MILFQVYSALGLILVAGPYSFLRKETGRIQDFKSKIIINQNPLM